MLKVLNVCRGRNGRVIYMKRSEGSYTVEAAVLVPLVLAVIVAMIQICLILHDRVVVREALEYAVLQATEENSDTDGRQGAAGETAASLTEDRLLLSDITDFGLEETVNGAKASVRIESRRIVPLYLGAGDAFVKEYCAKRKKPYAQEKTILSEVILDTLQVLQ